MTFNAQPIDIAEKNQIVCSSARTFHIRCANKKSSKEILSNWETSPINRKLKNQWPEAIGEINSYAVGEI